MSWELFGQIALLILMVYLCVHTCIDRWHEQRAKADATRWGPMPKLPPEDKP